MIYHGIVTIIGCIWLICLICWPEQVQAASYLLVYPSHHQQMHQHQSIMLMTHNKSISKMLMSFSKEIILTGFKDSQLMSASLDFLLVRFSQSAITNTTIQRNIRPMPKCMNSYSRENSISQKKNKKRNYWEEKQLPTLKNNKVNFQNRIRDKSMNPDPYKLQLLIKVDLMKIMMIKLR